MAESDKPYKVQEHRRERARVRTSLNSIDDFDELLLPDSKEFGNEYNAPKDGRQYVPINHPERTRTLRK
jgi:hypothetical protein